MANLDDPTADDLAEIRNTLRRGGYDVDALTDDEAVATLSDLLEEKIVAPAIPAGSSPVNGRLWLSEALTAGGFRQPNDTEQRAHLGDGGATVHLAVLGMLVMRHMSGSRPPDWTDEALSERVHQPAEDFTRGQKVLEEVAALIGRPATPEHHWWERP
jgi:hypothetical protein